MAQNTNGRHARGPVNDPKTGKFANAGAAVGGFVGAMGGSFVPPVNVTVNNNKNVARGNGAARTPNPCCLPRSSPPRRRSATTATPCGRPA